MEFNKDEIDFMKTLLEDELTRINMRRSNAKNLKEYDHAMHNRIYHINMLLRKMKGVL